MAGRPVSRMKSLLYPTVHLLGRDISLKTKSRSGFCCRFVYEAKCSYLRSRKLRCSTLCNANARQVVPVLLFPAMCSPFQESKPNTHANIAHPVLPTRRRINRQVLHTCPTLSQNGVICCSHATVPNSHPTPAVTAMASAPQNVTRSAPTATPAPPA
jgi:hypothetical protein